MYKADDLITLTGKSNHCHLEDAKKAVAEAVYHQQYGLIILKAYLLTTQIVKGLMLFPKTYRKHYPKVMLNTTSFRFRPNQAQTLACIGYMITELGWEFAWQPGSNTQHHSIKVTLTLQLLDN